MLDYVERVTAATTMEELWSLHCDAMAALRLSRLLYGLTWSRSRTRLGDSDDFLILTNLDEDYSEQFVHQGLYLHAPMVRWALENSGACSWSWIRDNSDALTAEEKKVVAFNVDARRQDRLLDQLQRCLGPRDRRDRPDRRTGCRAARGRHDVGGARAARSLR